MELRFVVPNMEKDIRELGVCRRKYYGTAENQRAYGCHYQKLQPVFRCAES